MLREIDKQLGLTTAIDFVLCDNHVQGKCDHTQLTMLRQRIYALATGYEDLNDHCTLRHDTVFQITVEIDTSLASMATLHRFEYQADRHTMIHLHDVLIQQFIDSFKTPPKKLILDLDATDNLIHGDQLGKYLNHYYDHHCFLSCMCFVVINC